MPSPPARPPSPESDPPPRLSEPAPALHLAAHVSLEQADCHTWSCIGKLAMSMHGSVSDQTSLPRLEIGILKKVFTPLEPLVPSGNDLNAG